MKKFMMLATILVAGLFIMPNVYAQDETNLKSEIEKAKTNGGTIVLSDDVTANDIIKIEDITNPITIDLNGHKITRESGNCVFTVKNSNVTFKDSSNGSGQIDKAGGSSIYVMDNSTVTIESGTYNGGIVVWGNNPTLNIEGGTITTSGFAVAGNGANTTNSTINISGGNLTSTGTAAIYQPQTGTIKVTNGNITGKIGIVARQGDITIEGGTITANGTGEASVGDATENSDKVKLPLGTAIVVDNKSAGYSESGNVTITGGEFNTEGSPVVSLENKAEDITISGGKFNKSINGIFLVKGLIQREDGTVVDPTVISNVKEETNPNTSDISLYLLVSLIAVSGCGIAYTVKRRFN